MKMFFLYPAVDVSSSSGCGKLLLLNRSWSSWSQRSSPCLQWSWIITHHFFKCNFDLHLFSLWTPWVQKRLLQSVHPTREIMRCLCVPIWKWLTFYIKMISRNIVNVCLNYKPMLSINNIIDFKSICYCLRIHKGRRQKLLSRFFPYLIQKRHL